MIFDIAPSFIVYMLALSAFQNYRFFSLDSVFREDGERDDPISLDLFGSKSISKSEYLFKTIHR